MARKRTCPPATSAPEPGTIRARLVRPGIVAVGDYQAGREYGLAPEEFARLEPRGFVRIEPPAAFADSAGFDSAQPTAMHSGLS